MFAFISACAAARCATAGFRPIGIVLLAGLLLGSCAARPELPVAAADPQIESAAVTYRPALTGYEAARPTEPKPWRERNDAVAPKEKAQ
jgi:hypothetical protein